MIAFTTEHIKCLSIIEGKLQLIPFSFTPDIFEQLEKFLLDQKPKEIVLTKQYLSVEATTFFATLVNKNSMKGTKLTDAGGERIGGLHTDWHSYNREKDAVDAKLDETTRIALQQFQDQPPEFVIDFGAGNGSKTLLTLKYYENVHIVAIDGNEEAANQFEKNIPEGKEKQVKVYAEAFVDFKSDKQADLLYASFTFPYRPPEDFPSMWDHAISLIKPGGIIAGHFFGKPENPDPSMTYHTEEELRTLLEKDFEIILLNTEKPGARQIYGGDTPAWGDLYHVVAKKLA